MDKKRSKGAQKGNKNARTHGGYSKSKPAPANKAEAGFVLTMLDLVRDLSHRQTEILSYAQQAADAEQPDSAIRALAVYGANAARLGRLLEKSGTGQGDTLTNALQRALNEAQDQIDQALRIDAGVIA